MFALTLLVLSQAAAPGCLTVDGVRTCGFDCKAAGGTVSCAKTPAGVCEKGTGGTIVCFDPPQWLTRVMNPVPKPTCVWRGASGACGYDCKALSDTVGCAQTPRGHCETAYGRIVCADPTAATYGVYGAEPPKPTCLAKNALVACGYSCVSSGVAIACAATPWGVCTTQGAQAQCFDPGERVICAGGKDTEKPVCKAFGDRLGCGYHCVDRGGVIACAQTPAGSCDVTAVSGPACFDPPVTGGSEDCLSVLGSR